MAQQTRLNNGLNVVSFNQPAQEYGAVFVVPTPAVDSSGIAHLIEHLVFRYSSRYPARHTLFAANALLPVKINASSHNGYSYFYTVSPNKSVLLKIIGYLFAGIQQIQYDNDDIRRERDGVIARELAMYESTPEYQRQMGIWRGDRAPDCYHHWGGYCDTLAAITTEDVSKYKSQFYRPDNITLLLAGVEAEELPPLCAGEFAASEDFYEPKQHRFISDTLQDDYIFSWWLPECYIDGLLSAKTVLDSLMEPYNMQVHIEESANHQRKFALRLIGRPGQLMAAQSALVDKIKRLHIVPKQHIFFESKYPETINTLLAWYHGQQPLNRKVVALSQALSLTPVITSIRPLRKPVMRIMTNQAHYNKQCMVVEESLSEASLDIPDTLPARVKPLADNLSADTHFVCNKQDWALLYPLDAASLKQQNSILVAVLCDERIWIPRTSGQCYAMGVQRVTDGIVIYGVMDDEPQQRKQYIKDLFEQYLIA